MSEKKRKRHSEKESRPSKRPAAGNVVSEVKVRLLAGAGEASPVIGTSPKSIFTALVDLY